MARSQLGQFASQADGRQIRVPPAAERELAHLARNRLDHLRMREADVVNVITVEIEKGPALKILDLRPLATLEDVEARR